MFKTHVLAFVLSAFVSIGALAQDTTESTEAVTVDAPEAQSTATVETPIARQVVTQGVRVSLMGGNHDLEIKVKNAPLMSVDYLRNQTRGVSLGYGQLNSNFIGYTANLTWIQINNAEFTTEAEMVRLDGNVAYPIFGPIFAKGGFNLAAFTNQGTFSSLRPQLGAQAGVIWQPSTRWGMELSYAQMNQIGNINGLQYEAVEKGAELALTGTF